MNRSVAGALLTFTCVTWGFFSGCAIVPSKPDEVPPLPKIEEPKPPPPLTLKGSHFQAFPWDEIKLRKDGTDPDTTVYTFTHDDTLDKVAEARMGDSALAVGLARFNEIIDANSIKEGDKIIIPDPIVGVQSRLVVKGKGDKEFGEPQPLDHKLSAGDYYKLRFEPNVNGYLYVYKTGVKGTVQLFPEVKPPAQKKRGRKPSPPEPAPEPVKVTARQEVLIPKGKTGFKFDSTTSGDELHVFFSMREIPALEGLRNAKTIKRTDLDLRDEISEAKTVTSGAVRVIRIKKPEEIIGFKLVLGVSSTERVGDLGRL